MKIVTVIPLSKGLPKEELTYFTAKNINYGDIVDIYIKNKKTLGLSIFSEEVSALKLNIKDLSFNLKKIDSIKEKSILRPEFFESSIKISEYFVSNKSNTIYYLIPKVIKEKYNEISKYETILSNQNNKNIRNEKLLFQDSLEERISTYKTIIRTSFAEKKSIFLVLPNETEIESFFSNLSYGIENFIFQIHPGLSPKKQLEIIKNILSTQHPIIILGTPQFLAIPRFDISTIILEKENSNSYKTISKPFIDLRIFVEIFSSKINSKLILADSLLRFETIARKELGLSEMRPLSFRIRTKNKIEIISTKKETETFEKNEYSVFKKDTVNKIKDALLLNRKIFIFALRKGLGTITICGDCNESLLCDTCNSPIVLYLSKDRTKRMFICNKCKNQKDTESLCKKCNSWNLKSFGIGTDTIYEEIKKLFPDVNLYKIDKYSVKNKKDAEKIIFDFENKEKSILIGTEMAFGYIKNKVDISIIASFDSLWSVPSFKINEKVINIILSINERTKETLFIQTKNPSDDTLISVQKENLLHFIKNELEDRKKLNYPPYCRFIKINYIGKKEEILEIKERFKKIFEGYSLEIFSGFISKIKNKYSLNFLIRLNYENWSLKELNIDSKTDENLYKKLSSLPKEFTITIDSEEL